MYTPSSKVLPTFQTLLQNMHLIASFASVEELWQCSCFHIMENILMKIHAHI